MSVQSSRKIGARIVILIAAVLTATSVLFLALFAPLYRQEVAQERKATSLRLAGMLQIALENAMLKRDIPGLRQIVDGLGRSPDVDLVMIIAPSGEVRFSSDSTQIGRRTELEALCAGCDGLINTTRPGAEAAGFVRNARGAFVLRSVRAVANREACSQCHGPPDSHPVNGFLVVDYSAADIAQRTWSAAALLGGAGVLVIAAALATIWLALRRTVVRPLEQVSDAIARYAEDPSAPPSVDANVARSRDEIANLVGGWNWLVARLDAATREMRLRDAFLQSVIDAAPDGIRVIADDYTVVAANVEFCRQAGRKLEEVVGQPCYLSSHGRSEPCAPTLVVCPLVETRTRKERVKASHIHLDKSTGIAFAAEVAAAEIVGAQDGGRGRLIVESIRNLSQQVQISQEQRLSELGHLAAGVAHEIHNPLASVRLGLRAIERNLTTQSAETREFMSAVDTEVDRCITVTERLMRLSRLPDERGALVDVAQVARDVAALLRYEAEQRNVEISLSIADNARIVAAEADLGMVLINLMQNALHAMPNGGRLTISADFVPDGDVHIRVADTGVGIPAAHLSEIFHPFWSWRADGSAGSGLGLAICKASTAKWDGRITVRSEVGAGSTFELAFPHADKVVSAS